MKHEHQVMEILRIYRERRGTAVTAESLYDFLQDAHLPRHLVCWRHKTKRELSALLRTYVRDKKKERNNRTVFLI